MIDFRDVITEQVLADYLTAEFGHDLSIWDDGSYEIIESNLRWKHGGPCVRVKCPGIGNLDSSWFAEGFAKRDESGNYIEICSGRVIGDLKDLIIETCLEGDVSECIDELISDCNNQAMDNVYPFKD